MLGHRGDHGRIRGDVLVSLHRYFRTINDDDDDADDAAADDGGERQVTAAAAAATALNFFYTCRFSRFIHNVTYAFCTSRIVPLFVPFVIIDTIVYTTGSELARLVPAAHARVGIP